MRANFMPPVPPHVLCWALRLALRASPADVDHVLDELVYEAPPTREVGELIVFLESLQDIHAARAEPLDFRSRTQASAEWHARRADLQVEPQEEPQGPQRDAQSAVPFDPVQQRRAARRP